MRILVAYATSHGSTKEVAEAVAETLREADLEPELLEADHVHDLAGYDAVVLGGALYMGRLHGAARRLLRRFRPELQEMPFAVFAMGPLTTKERDVAGARKQLDHALSKARGVEPFAVAIFGGVVHSDEQRFPFNHMPETDARDWEAIHAWAAEVAPVFKDKVLYERNPLSADSTRSASVARL